MADAISNPRLLRLIHERGWTQARTAELVNAEYERTTGVPGSYRDDHIRRLTRGEVTWPHPPYRQAFCRVFGVTEAELGFRPKRRTYGTVTKQEESDMRRVEFLRGLAALSGSVLSAGGLFGTLEEASAQTAIPKRVGPEDVDQIRSITAILRDADNAGHGLAGEAMAAQLRYAVGLLDAHAGRQTKTALHVAVGQLSDVIGWAHFDAGQHKQADRYFRIGLHCADQAGAWWLRADILSDMARQAVYLGEADDALTLLGTAKIREDQVSPLRRANLCAVQARAYSQLGEIREAARSVASADQFFSERAVDHGEPDWATYAEYFCEAQLAGDTGHGLWAVAVKGHEVDNARHRLGAAIDGYSDQYARSRLFCVARLAALTLQQGDPDEGVALGRRALDGARGVRSMRVVDDIAEIHRSTARLQRKHPVVAELRTETAQFLRTSTSS